MEKLTVSTVPQPAAAVKMRLIRLHLRNFKGAKNFTLETNGGDVVIYGANRSGKTTITDAYQWLLYGRDSHGRADFGIKTHENGTVIHGLNHEVEAAFDVGGETLTLHRVYAEKWTKKKGSSEAEFSGHTTEYFIDTIPAQEKEYKLRVAALADEPVMRLLSDPHHFNRNLTWQQRRTLLLEVCGDVSDADVIAGTPALGDLAAIMGKRTNDELRKMLAARRTELNKELDRLPVRIDEATRGLPEAGGYSLAALQKEVADVEAAKDELLKKRLLMSASDKKTEKVRELREAEIAALEAERQDRLSAELGMKPLREEEGKMLSLVAAAKAMAEELPRKVARNTESVKRLEAERQKLREAWHKIHAETWTASTDEVCPTCGQALPAEAVQEAHDKALANYNTFKAQRLEEIAAKGKAIKGEIEALQKEIADADAEASRCQAQITNGTDALSALASKIQRISSYDDPSKMLIAARARVKALQEAADNVAVVDTSEQDIAIKDAEWKIANLRQLAARIEQRKAGLLRIAELKAQQKELAAEWERLERELYLSDELIRAKVRLLEERINSRFRVVKFKLFEVQVNGAVSETCVATYDGTPYSDMSGAERINAGLDIIDALGKHYNFVPPIIVDERESVSELLPVENQVISLVVSPADKVLRVEYEEGN